MMRRIDRVELVRSNLPLQERLANYFPSWLRRLCDGSAVDVLKKLRKSWKQLKSPTTRKFGVALAAEFLPVEAATVPGFPELSWLHMQRYSAEENIWLLEEFWLAEPLPCTQQDGEMDELQKVFGGSTFCEPEVAPPNYLVSNARFGTASDDEFIAPFLSNSGWRGARTLYAVDSSYLIVHEENEEAAWFDYTTGVINYVEGGFAAALADIANSCLGLSLEFE